MCGETSAVDEDLAGLGGRLEPCRDVDGIACDERLPERRVAGDDLASRDSYAHVDRHPEGAAELVVESCESVSHLSSGANGPKRIVLVEGRDPEDGHEGVADVLLDRAAVPLDDCVHDLEVAVEHSTRRLRLEPLHQRRRPHDVRKHDGDDLSCLSRAREDRCQPRTASVAELGAFGIRLAAVGAASHVAKDTSAGVAGAHVVRVGRRLGIRYAHILPAIRLTGGLLVRVHPGSWNLP